MPGHVTGPSGARTVRWSLLPVALLVPVQLGALGFLLTPLDVPFAVMATLTFFVRLSLIIAALSAATS